MTNFQTLSLASKAEIKTLNKIETLNSVSYKANKKQKISAWSASEKGQFNFKSQNVDISDQ